MQCIIERTLNEILNERIVFCSSKVGLPQYYHRICTKVDIAGRCTIPILDLADVKDVRREEISAANRENIARKTC